MQVCSQKTNNCTNRHDCQNHILGRVAPTFFPPPLAECNTFPFFHPTPSFFFAHPQPAPTPTRLPFSLRSLPPPLISPSLPVRESSQSPPPLPFNSIKVTSVYHSARSCLSSESPLYTDPLLLTRSLPSISHPKLTHPPPYQIARFVTFIYSTFPLFSPQSTQKKSPRPAPPNTTPFADATTAYDAGKNNNSNDTHTPSAPRSPTLSSPLTCSTHSPTSCTIAPHTHTRSPPSLSYSPLQLLPYSLFSLSLSLSLFSFYPSARALYITRATDLAQSPLSGTPPHICFYMN